MRTTRSILYTSAAMLSLMASGTAFAGPEGGVVSRGSATITQTGKKTDIRQKSGKVILDWRSFDIGADEHTEFHQPSKNAIALNRINDTKASQIDGKLTANGNIMLINPNGVVFGKGAQVNVGSLTATTADIDDDDFMAGKMDFKNAGSTAGKIVNNGSITVKDAGLVNFVAPTVENNGVIVAKLGKVQLAAADTFTLDMAGDGILQVAVNAEEGQKIARNSGTITAQGGYVAVTAEKARGLIDSLVDNSGVIEASSMTTKGGKVILSAAGGTTKNSGTIKANGKKGGGEILIGGDYQGIGDTKNSKNTEIAQSSVIEASATNVGNGGKVIVWADENTTYDGTIKAQGGAKGGNGGFVETSGKANLHIAEGSNVTASARHENGDAGTWLLDPSNVTITNGSGNNIPGAGGTVNPATDGYTINAASISTALNGGNNVIITTTNGAGTEQGDITVTNATISKTTVNNSVTLTLRAARNITVENSTISSTSDSLGVTLNADRDANSTGAIKVVNSTLELNGGSFIAGGGTAPTTTAAVATQDGIFDVGVLIDNSSIRTNGAGNIILNGRGEATGNNNYGILITNNSVLRTSTTGSTGTITLNGTGGAGGSNNHGVYIAGGSIVRSDRGATITGTGGSNGTIGSTNNVGVYIAGGAGVRSQGTGASVNAITITGVGGAGYSDNHGIRLDGDTSHLYVTDGDLVLNGTSGYNGALGASPGTNYGVLMSTDSDITSSSATVGEAGNITINSVGEDTVLGGDTITSIAGNITINANTLNTTLDSISSTSGNITIAPYTASGSIGLGGGSGTLSLTDAELATISTGGKLVIGKSGTGTGDIDLDSWDYSSKSYSGIELYGNDIDVGGLTMGAGYFLAYAKDNGVDYGDLNVSANIARGAAGASTLDLQADRNISVDTADITATTGSLNVVLNADRNANQDGAVEVYDSNITTNGGYFIAGGGSGTRGGTDGIFGNGDGTGADDVAAWGNSVLRDGVQFDTVNLTTGTGNVFLKGHGSLASGASNAMGVSVYDGKITTTSGHVVMVGTAGNGTSGSYSGVVMISADGIETDGGNMYLYGYDAATNGDYGRGLILMHSGLLAKNNGSITLLGESDLSGTDTSSLRLDSSTVETQGSGSIILDGSNMSNWGATASTVGGALATGNITLNVDTVDFSNVGSFQTSGNIYVTPKTASRSIGLGGGAGDLNLTDTELASFNGTGKLIIGNSVSGTGDIDLDSWNWSSKLFTGVEIYGNDIDIGGMTMGTGNFLAHAMDNGGDTGSLNVSSAITRSVNGVATLDLRADQDITVNANIIANDANSDADGNAETSADSLNIILNSDRDNDSNGSIALTGSTINMLGGYFVAGGGSGTVGGTNGVLGDGDGTGADDDFAYGVGSGNGITFTTSTITTGDGKVFINGFASGNGTSHGIFFDRSQIYSGNGDMVLRGYSTGNTSNPKGVSFNGNVFNQKAGLISTGGDIKIVASTTSAQALYLFEDSEILTTDGDIDITAFNTSAVVSIAAGGTSPTNTISSTNGNVTLALEDANLTDFQSIHAGNTLTIKNYDPAASIGLGGASGDLALNDTELTRLSGGKLVIGDALLGTGDVSIDTWNFSGKTFNVEVYGNDIDVGGLNMGTGSFMAYAKDNGVDYGDLNVSAAIARATAGNATLDLRADRNITLGSNITTTNGLMNVILNSDRNANQNGSIRVSGSTTTTNGGYFVAGGGSGTVGGVNGILGDGDGTGADDVAAWGNDAQVALDSLYASGVAFFNSSITTNTGNIFAKGQGWAASTLTDSLKSATGVRLNGSSLTTTDGTINLHGIAGGTTGSGLNIGVYLHDTSSLTSTGGDITLYGKGGSVAGSTDSHGVALSGSTVNKITTTTGSVLLNGEIGSTSSNSLFLRSSNSTTGGIFSLGSGTITLRTVNGRIDTGTATFGGNSATGDISLISDGLNLTANTTFRTTGSIFVKAVTDSRTIGLGGGTGDLNLTDAELGYFNAGNKFVIGDALTTGDIDLDSWDWSTKLFSVELYGNDIDIGGMTMGTGSFLAHAMDNGVDYGDLNISANITRAVNGDATLDLRADRNIVNSSSAGIIASDANSDADGNPSTSPDRLTVILNADRDADQDGTVRLSSATITTLGGNFIAGGGSGAVGGVNGILGDGDGTGADDVAAWGNSVYLAGLNLTSTTVNTSAGNIYMKGQGYANSIESDADLSASGIRLVGSSLTTTGSGSINLHGTGGGTTGSNINVGVFLRSAGTIQTADGDINIYGKGGAIGSNSHGLGFSGSGVNTLTTANGTINVRAEAADTTRPAIYGASINGGIFSTGTGDINLTALNSSITTVAAFTIGGNTSQGDITLEADLVDLSAGTNIRTTGDIWIKPRTASASIGLGGGSGDLNLTDAELGYLNTTGKLIIGNALLGTGDIDLDSWNWSAKNFSGIEIYGNSIDIGGMTMGAGNFLAHAMDNGVDYGDINISANITRGVNGVSTLDLRADRNITNSNGADIIATDANSDADGNPATSADSLNVILNADRDADQSGAINLAGAAVTTLGGNFIAGGGSGVIGGINGILGDGDGTGADDVAAWGNGTNASGIYIGNTSNINTGAGSIYLSGHGRDDNTLDSQFGVNLFSGGNLSTTSGRIEIYGQGGISSSNSYGAQMHASTVTTATGFIDIDAQSGAAPSGNSDFVIFNNSVLESTGSGSIRITGRSGGNSNFNVGMTGANRVGSSTMTGDIEIIGNTIQINDTDNSILSQGNIYIKPLTDSQSIGLGGGSGGLNLTDSELSNFNGPGKLIIGNSATGTGDIDLDSWDWSSKNFSGIELYGNDIDIGGMTMGAGNFLAHAMDNGVDYGDINISASITRGVNGAATLDLRADRNITNSNGADIVASDANSDADGNPETSPDSLNVILNADRDADHDGAVTLTNATITTLGGNLIAGGGSGTVGGVNGILGDGDGTGADDVAAWGNSSYLRGIGFYITDITTGAGDIYLTGHGYNSVPDSNAIGVSLDGNVVTTSGNIVAKGTGGAGNQANYGFYLNSGKVSSATGRIKVHGTGGGSVQWNDGVLLSTNTAIESTGSATIDITAIPGTGTGTSGLLLRAGAVIGGASASGDITINSDVISLDSAASIRSSGTTTVKAVTNSASIGLGGGSGTLNLDDSELATFNGTGKLIIGNSLLGTGDIDLDSWNWSSKNFSGIELYGNDIDIGGMTMGAGNFLAHAMDNGVDYGDINISANITRGVNGVSTLDLRADRNIVNSNGADIIASDANSDADNNPVTSADSLNVILNADRNANNTGSISLTNATITTLGGNFIAGGGSGTVGGVNGILGDGDGTGADDVAAWDGGSNGVGVGLTSSSVSTGAGTIVMSGHGYNDITVSAHYGINLDASSLLTTSGNIYLTGTGGASSTNAYGVQVNGSSVSTDSGAIDIKGNAGTTAGGDGGIIVFGTSVIEATGNGSITLTGKNSVQGRDFSIGSAGTNRIGNAAMTGKIEINANTILLNDTDDTIITRGDTVVKATSASQSIGLGGGTGDLNLTDNELSIFNGTGKLIIGNALLGTGDIDLDSWNWSSKLFDVELYGNDIDIGGMAMGVGDFMAYAKDNGGDYGDLNYSADITRGVNGNATLELRADRNITNSGGASITASDANSDGDGNPATDADNLNVILNADRNGINDAGTVNLASGSILSNGGNITLGGGTGVITAGSGFAKAPMATYFNGVNIGGTIDAQGGNVVINGDANGYFAGVAIGGTGRVRTSGTGTIDIYGIGGTGNSNTRGVSAASGSIISNNGGTGNININGRIVTVLGTDNHAVSLAGNITSGGLVNITGVSTRNGHGVNLANTGTITTTGSSGSLSVTGTGHGTGYNGINFVTHATNTVSTESGDITLTSLAGDIVLDKEIRKTGAGNSTLTIQTPGNIVLNGEADITATSGSLNVVLNADRDADNSGAISLTGVDVTTLGGYFVAGGGSGTLGGTNGILGDGDGTGADDVAAWGTTDFDAGIATDTVTINTAAGSIYMKGHGYANSTQNVNTSSASGIRLIATSLEATGSGAINLHGIASGTTGSDYSIGVFLRGGTSVDTENGDITIYGKSGTFGNNSHGVAFSNIGTNTVSTTDGDIDLQGETGDASTGSSSIYISSPSGGITSDGAGNITLTALNDEIRRALTGTFTIGGTSATGDISLISDGLTISNMDIETGGDIYIKAIDSTKSIGLGGGSGDLNLTDTELALFGGTGKLIIGDSVIGTGDIDLDSWDWSSKNFSDIELYGNDIDIGGMTMGAGDFVAYAKDNGVDVGDLTMSAAVTRGVGGTSALDLRADRNIVFNSGANVTSTTGEIDLTVDANYDNVGTGVITYNASSIDTNGGDLNLADNVTLGADTAWNARGGTFTTGGTLALGANDLVVTADNVGLGGSITGNASSILTLKPYDNNRSIGLGGGAGDFNLTDAELSGLTVGHLIIGDAAAGNGDVTIQSWSLSGKSYDVELYGRDMDINGMTMGGGDITMIAGRDVTTSGAIGNSGAGGDLYIDVGNDFVNTAGASAISMGPGGRFLIYIDDLSHITRGGMTTGNLFGRDYTNDDPSSIATSFGNRFVFDETPTLTVVADDVTLGAYNPGYSSFTYSVTGLATGDTAGSSLDGNPAYSTTQLTPTTYSITPSTGTLTSELGYLIAFQNGLLTMPVDPGTTPPPTTPPVTQPPPTFNIPASVEHQIQLPQVLFSEGYQVVSAANSSFADGGDSMLIQRKMDGFRVNTNEKDAFMRMVTGGYLQVEQPVVDYYGLSGYSSDEL